jgi:hypothetical protein
MKRVVGIATIPGREENLKAALKSLRGQYDEIYIYDNGKLLDLSDNGKFYGLAEQSDPCYFFSCDDSILYPEDYIEETIKNIKEHGCIITYHGRSLTGIGRDYYREHISFHYKNPIAFDMIMDVAGTGVTGFGTDYFNPVGITSSVFRNMSDLVFSLIAAEEKKKIILPAHRGDWIIQQFIDITKTIRGASFRRADEQRMLADEICKIKGL